MGNGLKDMLGGSLRPSDPRRFLIEAMIGAMNSDGYVDPRELDALHRLLAEHELFATLRPETARVLIDLGTDAVQMAGDGRIDAVARGLPARTHRLAAFAMASEVCVADQEIHEAEVRYMENLSRALHLAAHETHELFDAARHYQAMEMLAHKIDSLSQLTPMIVDTLALAHCLERRVRNKHKKRLRELLRSLIDIQSSPDSIEAEVTRALHPLNHSQDVGFWLERLAQRVPDAADRYWLAVYVALEYAARGKEEWREVRFFSLLERAFAIVDMGAVFDHGKRLLAMLQRG